MLTNVAAQQAFRFKYLRINNNNSITATGVFSYFFSSFNCWKCKKDNQMAELECGKCGYLLQPDYSIKKQNFYTLFRMYSNPQQTCNHNHSLFFLTLRPIKYNIDKKAITLKHNDLQRRFHPDKFTLKDKQQSQYSTQFSAYASEAKAVLLDDLKRAIYMVLHYDFSYFNCGFKLTQLEIKGVKIDQAEMNHDLEPGFLMKVFQLQEEVEEETSLKRLTQMLNSCIKEIENLKTRFGENYQKNNLDVCKKIVIQYKYYERIRAAIQKKIGQYDGGEKTHNYTV